MHDRREKGGQIFSILTRSFIKGTSSDSRVLFQKKIILDIRKLRPMTWRGGCKHLLKMAILEVMGGCSQPPDKPKLI